MRLRFKDVKKIVLAVMGLLLLAVPVFYWASGLMPSSSLPVVLHDVGRLCTLVAFVLLFFQVVLSARVKWIERGIGLDRLFGVHKRFGVLVLGLVLVHPSLIFLSERLQGQALPFGFFKLLGLITLLILLASAGAALVSRPMGLKYETWKRIHKAGYLVVPLAFGHSFLMGGTLQKGPVQILWMLLLLAYGVILAHRMIRWIVLRRRPFRVAEVRKESASVCTVVFEGGHRDYKPGQFMIVQLKRNGVVSEPHPFTLSSSPTQEKIAVTVKAVGDFTSTLNHTKVSDSGYIDMPYGVFSFLNSAGEDFVFIAGGIGITPFISMLRYMHDKALQKPVLLLWANKTEEDILFRQELERLAEARPSLKIVHVLSRQNAWPGEKGHIDEERLRKYVKDFETPHFFICGPPRMMKDLQSTLRRFGVPGKRIHMERFALR